MKNVNSCRELIGYNQIYSRGTKNLSQVRMAFHCLIPPLQQCPSELLSFVRILHHNSIESQLQKVTPQQAKGKMQTTMSLFRILSRCSREIISSSPKMLLSNLIIKKIQRVYMVIKRERGPRPCENIFTPPTHEEKKAI